MTDKELLEQFQMLAAMIQDVEQRMSTKDDLDERFRHTEILIETKITKRLDALTDGYKLVHEKQWEMERRMEKLEQLVQELQSKIA